MAKKLLKYVLIFLIQIFFLEVFCRIYLLKGYDSIVYSPWYKEKWLLRQQWKTQDFSPYLTDEYDTLLGWKLKPMLNNVSVGNWKVSSNAFACRGKDTLRVGAPKWLFIGDSFTFGECVNDTENFAAYLRQYFPVVDILNMAVHGYGHDQQYLRFKRDGLALQPSVVVFGFVNDDVPRNSLSFRDYAKPFFVLKNNGLSLQNVPVPKPEELQSSYYLKIVPTIDALFHHQFSEEEHQKNQALTLAIWKKMTELCLQNDILPVVVYLPSFSECRSGILQADSVYYRLKTVPGLHFIEPLDTLHDFVGQKADAEKLFQCHYSPEIHQVIAAKIALEMKRIEVLNH